MSAFEIYLLALLGDLKGALIFLCLILSVCSVMATIIALADGDDGEVPWLRRLLKPAICALAVCALLALAIPGKKTIAAMYVVPYVTRLEGIEKMPPDLVRVIRKFAREYLEEEKNE